MAAEGLADDDLVMRLTADCPLLDPTVCGMVLRLARQTAADHAGNIDPPGWPDGLDCEVFTAGALRLAAAEATRPGDREHVGPFVRRNRARFKVVNLPAPLPGLADHRWTLDTAEDLAFLRALTDRLGAAASDHLAVLDLLAEAPDLARPPVRRAQGEPLAPQRVDPETAYRGSDAALARALKTIPLGAQTFSKSHQQFPAGRAPLVLTHGAGGRTFDVDGNPYVDLIGGLLPITLGHRDPEVDGAVRDQLARGVTLSLSTALEAELAERLVALIPAAEKVRFGKNGSDATSAAVRLARAFTGRERIVALGYHGWHDWYIGATSRRLGVPAAVSALTTTAPYNDPEALARILAAHPGEVAAVVMEPMNLTPPAEGYLQTVAELTRKHGALLVFDEIITGFRFHLGGAQALFGVTPDLACLGKGMANGLPLSAVVGRAEVMDLMEEIFFSGTFGGEALSLAGAIATLDKMAREPVIDHLWATGRALAEGLEERLKARGLAHVIGLGGLDPWRILTVADHPKAPAAAIKTRLLIEMLARGVLLNASHNVCYAHRAADVDLVLAAYDGALDRLAEELADGRLVERLPCPVIEPVFKVRG